MSFSSYRVYHGGSWLSSARGAGTVYRLDRAASFHYRHMGFRFSRRCV